MTKSEALNAIKEAKKVYVEVSGEHDVCSVRISKAAAIGMFRNTGFGLGVMTINGNVVIGHPLGEHDRVD